MRTITASFLAILGAAALAGPVAADSHEQPGSWYAGKSTIAGSMRSDEQRANNPARANVYVPPAVDRADDSAKANVYVPPNPEPIQRDVATTSAASSGFDWGSAGIGAAVAIGALLSTLGGAAALRRRRQIRPAAAG
jgi:hypothetical protein